MVIFHSFLYVYQRVDGDPSPASIPQGELIDPIVQGDEDRGAWPVQRHDGHHLVPTRGTDESGGLVPNADDGPHGPVVVHDGTTVQGIPAEDVLAILGDMTRSVSSARQKSYKMGRESCLAAWKILEMGGAHMTYDMQHTSTQRVPL